MIKKTVSYSDWDGKTRTRDLYFHIGKMELLDNMDIKDEIEAFQATISGEQRDLNQDEIRTILDIFKRFVKMAYGEREGDDFLKSEAIWDRFKSSMAYDELLWGLIKNPEEGFDFLVKVMPADLIAEAERAQNQPQLPLEGDVVTPEPTAEELEKARRRAELQRQMDELA